MKKKGNEKPKEKNKDTKLTQCSLCDKDMHQGGITYCWELEQNKERRPKGWESALTKKIKKRNDKIGEKKRKSTSN